MYLLLALWGAQLLVFLSWAGWVELAPLRALNLAAGIFLLLIVAAVSRISMQIVNGALNELGEHEQRYLARPPRRNLAMAAIIAFLALDLWLPQEAITGWIALAAAAAVLNLLNDWHLGKVLRHSYVAALYTTYWLLALGFGLIGLDYLLGVFPANHARHLLTSGAIGMAMLAVLAIAGQRHTGRYALSHAPAIRLAFICVLLGALVRSFAPVLTPQWHFFAGYGLSSLVWSLGFVLYLAIFWRYLTQPRVDGKPG
nr:NnrS family protein [Alkalilimnicola ehrlichii]